ncbi:hypothetical protein NADFUDRAFT_82544 [Nadsonia fulvescens var. elongata DSM 6958]|uniref:Uncharacterized protein n=1 Tax=Nadsonia fulvescens var. elongata DSM 6958 TaxID=857566 RepID=A0A1E3PNE3_9ASCO|nr:hypothetical protein NADFUDRAFT_82544 [Nadsonia fulvescens var. elongata DSM 6958]
MFRPGLSLKLLGLSGYSITRKSAFGFNQLLKDDNLLKLYTTVAVSERWSKNYPQVNKCYGLPLKTINGYSNSKTLISSTLGRKNLSINRPSGQVMFTRKFSISGQLLASQWGQKPKLNPFQSFIYVIPPNIRFVFGIFVSACIVFFVLAPLILFMVPIVMLASVIGFFYFRRLQRSRINLFQRRWKDIEHSNLYYKTSMSGFNSVGLDIRSFALKRIKTALANNEYELRDKLLSSVKDEITGRHPDNNLNRIQLSPIEMMDEDAREGSNGILEQLTALSMGLVQTSHSKDSKASRRLAYISVILRGKDPQTLDDLLALKNQSVLIEITPVGLNADVFVLDTDPENLSKENSDQRSDNDNSNVIIDIKPSKR